MKGLLLLWVEMDVVRGTPQKQAEGFVYHSHPLNAGLCQVGFVLDKDKWRIECEKPHGSVVVVSASGVNSLLWQHASLMLWVPMGLAINGPTKVMGLTHCSNPLMSPCMGNAGFALHEWKVHAWQSDGETTLHSLIDLPRPT